MRSGDQTGKLKVVTFWMDAPTHNLKEGLRQCKDTQDKGRPDLPFEEIDIRPDGGLFRVACRAEQFAIAVKHA